MLQINFSKFHKHILLKKWNFYISESVTYKIMVCLLQSCEDYTDFST